MSRFSKVSSIFGRDAAMYDVTSLSNVSEIRDMATTSAKSLSKMMITLLPGLRVSERHVNQSSEITKSRNHEKRKCGKAITIVL